MKYPLPLPPTTEAEGDALALAAQLDHFALQEVPTQVDMLNDLSIATVSSLLADLERVRAEHEARARNVESSASIVRDHLHAVANAEHRTIVGMAAHVGKAQATPAAVSPGYGL